MMHVVDVEPPGGAPYPVHCGGDLAAGIGAIWRPTWRRAAIVADETTATLFGTEARAAITALGAEVVSAVFPSGEAQKTRVTKAQIEDAILDAGLDRTSCIVAVGGGVVLDLAGFVAATYMRGIDHVNIATTLLAQVDAAVGGKTAVNVPRGKNLVGAFHHPRAVLLHTGALDALPDAELRNGLAEMVKHALVADAVLFADLSKWAAARTSLRPPDDMIARAVRVKTAIVARDDKDRGVRELLNFGHTVAHAIEHATGHETAHGHAVAIGMVVEARMAAAAGAFPGADVDRLVALLSRLGLPTSPPCSFDEAAPFLGRDKKTEHGTLRCAVPDRIGEATPDDHGRWARAVPAEALRAAWGAPGSVPARFSG
jgi:3-dehydroquinate synthase